uniref:Uncharacterized protein n=1 Tax=Cannabis sativa TaxID=3483 RepID=A0A803QTS2_CANSA
MNKEAEKIISENQRVDNKLLLAQNDRWVMNMESCNNNNKDINIESRSIDSSLDSIESSSSSELVEDASSSSSSKSSSSTSISSFSSSNNGPLYELSELMVHLPIRYIFFLYNIICDRLSQVLLLFSSGYFTYFDFGVLNVFLYMCRRGLSKYYQGKSQSFTSLANAVNVEDLPKKVSPYRRKMMMKSCKSYGGGLDSKLHYPKGLISKKSTARGSLLFSRHL